MKTTLFATTLCLLPTLAHADGSAAALRTFRATVYNVQPIYENVRVDYYKNVCKNVRNKGNQLEGAIIGGLIGNQFGNGNGKDAMTALGALLGAGSAGRNETHCYQEKVTYIEPAFVAWSVSWEWMDRSGNFQTNDHYEVGDRIFMELK